MHEARSAYGSSYRDGSHWADPDEAVLHPGRLADCALCLLSTPDEADA